MNHLFSINWSLFEIWRVSQKCVHIDESLDSSYMVREITWQNFFLQIYFLEFCNNMLVNITYKKLSIVLGHFSLCC